MENKTQILIFVNRSLQEQVRLADGKATAVITFKLIMLAFMRTQAGTFKLAFETSDTVAVMFLTLFIITFMISTVYVLRVIIPRVLNLSLEHSGIFFHQIAKMEKDEYLEVISNQSVEDISKDLAMQNYALASIADSKYKYIHKTIIYFSVANVCFWMALLRLSFLQ